MLLPLALRLANVYELDLRSGYHGMGRDRPSGGPSRYYNGSGSSAGRAYGGATPMELGMMTASSRKQQKPQGNRPSKQPDPLTSSVNYIAAGHGLPNNGRPARFKRGKPNRGF